MQHQTFSQKKHLIEVTSLFLALRLVKVLKSSPICYKRALKKYFFACINKHVVVCAQSCLTLSHPMDYRTPGSSVHGFSKHENWNGLPFPTRGDLPDPEIDPMAPESPVSADEFCTIAPPGKLTLVLHVFSYNLCFLFPLTPASSNLTLSWLSFIESTVYSALSLLIF